MLSVLQHMLCMYHRNSVGKLLKDVTSTKIHGQYAKAREVDKKYMEAARAYETAKEYDNAIRYSIYTYTTQISMDEFIDTCRSVYKAMCMIIGMHGLAQGTEVDGCTLHGLV